MRRRGLPLSVCFLAAVAALCQYGVVAQSSAGSIKGRVRLTGKPPGNSIVRMGVDPLCGQLHKGERVIQETVVTSTDGGLANVFVKLDGKFPVTPVPATAVTIDQRGCIYFPRMTGMRVGQTLEIRNSDPLLHNLHGYSAGYNGFNVTQQRAGLVYRFQPKAEEMMLKLKCDVHRWMNAYVGIVGHPYFSVTARAGDFEIANVPGGSYKIHAWHERYGLLTQTVRVKTGATTTVDFTYTGAEKPDNAGLRTVEIASLVQLPD